MTLKPILIFAYGNPSRGDDALAPLLLESLQKLPALLSEKIELLTDFQLQIEHALDLQHRTLVLFIDASLANQQPVELVRLQPRRDNSHSTHAISPQAVMQVYLAIEQQPLPPCFLLSVRGRSFQLGDEISDTAKHSLQQASKLLNKLLQNTTLHHWQALCNA